MSTASVEWPSSSRKSVGAMLRLGYELLHAMHGQMFKGKRLFLATARDIDSGRFRILRAQWASYIPTGDRLQFLKLLPIIYGRTIARDNGTVNLAHHLGLIFDPYPRDGTERQTGVMLQKRHGQKPAWSVVFYDKRTRLGQMRQLGTLTDAELKIVKSSVRLDVTANPPGIIAICKAAQRRLADLSPEVWPWAEEFVEERAEASAWWLERAVVALSWEEERGRWACHSFAGWLLPKMLDNVTHLRAMANFSRNGFLDLTALEDPVVDAWRKIEWMDDTKLMSELIKHSGLKRAAVYKRRRSLLDRFGIDILVPYGFYRDMLFLVPTAS